jgi:hypothetical protein
VSAFGIDPSAYQVPATVAVDSAGAGGVYVSALDTFSFSALVVKYSAAGAFSHVLDASGSTTTVNYGPIAVDPGDGTVYVTATDTTTFTPVIDSFDQATGAFVASFDGSNGSPDGGFICPAGLAVDATHRVYVLDPCKGRVDRYSSVGVYGATVDGGSRGSPSAVATDPVSGEVYVAESGPRGLQVTNFTAGGASPVQTFAATGVGSLSTMAVGPDGTVYLGDGTNSVVGRFTAFEGPTVITAAASGIGTTSVMLNGTVDPGGVATHCRYEYGLDTGYGTTGPVFDVGGGSVVVSAPGSVLGLVPNTAYHYRIVCFHDSDPGSIVGLRGLRRRSCRRRLVFMSR